MKKSTGLFTGLTFALALIVPTIASAATGGNDVQAFINYLAQYFNNGSLAAVIVSHDGTVTASTTPPTVSLTVNGATSTILHVGDVVNYVWSSTNADTFSSSYDSSCGSGRWIANGPSGSNSGVIGTAFLNCSVTITYATSQKATHLSANQKITVRVLPRDTDSTSTPVITVATTTSEHGIITPVYSLPTATFTINGTSSALVSPGDYITYQWSSTNADRSVSSYSSSNPLQCGYKSEFNINSISGTKTGKIVSADLNCDYKVNYKVTQSLTGKTDEASVTFKVRSASRVAEIASSTDSSVAATSSAATSTSIVVTSPIKGTHFRAGSPMFIGWTSNGVSSVAITVMKTIDRSYGDTIVSPTPSAATSSYLWNIPANYNDGSNYYLAVISRDDSTIYGRSGTFSIEKQTTPNATGTVATTTPYTFTSDLTVNYIGKDVAALQSFLELKGFLTMPKGVVKGYFGNVTKKALAAYQKSVGLKADGGFGPITRGVVNQDPVTADIQL